jgi:hypothetical protein
MGIRVLNSEPGNIYSLNPEEERRKERVGGGEENKTYKKRERERRSALPSGVSAGTSKSMRIRHRGSTSLTVVDRLCLVLH